MHQLADEIREVFDERGYRIGQAVSADPAFSRGCRSRSSLGRDLVLATIEESTSRLGLGFTTVSGGGCEVVDFVNNTNRWHRVRKAERDTDTDGYTILCDSDAILSVPDDDSGLYPSERWVLGYTVDESGVVAEIFSAKVLGLSSDPIPSLVLASVTALGTPHATPPDPGFQPLDDDDLGDEFESGDEADGDTETG